MNRPAAAVIAELQTYAASVGMVLTSRCTRCKAPLVNPDSLHRKVGPVCRSKTKNDGPGSLAKESTGTAVTSTYQEEAQTMRPDFIIPGRSTPGKPDEPHSTAELPFGDSLYDGITDWDGHRLATIRAAIDGIDIRRHRATARATRLTDHRGGPVRWEHHTTALEAA